MYTYWTLKDSRHKKLCWIVRTSKRTCDKILRINFVSLRKFFYRHLLHAEDPVHSLLEDENIGGPFRSASSVSSASSVPHAHSDARSPSGPPGAPPDLDDVGPDGSDSGSRSVCPSSRRPPGPRPRSRSLRADQGV